MKYRKLGNTDLEISELSLGVLRVEDSVRICEDDQEEKIAVIRFAIDQGVNWINLGYPDFFANPDQACKAVRLALKDGYRERVMISVNFSALEMDSWTDLDNRLYTSMELFGIKKTDIVIISDVQRLSWQHLRSVDFAGWAKKTILNGRTNYFALDFRDHVYYLKDIFDVYPDWAFVQIGFSILDYTNYPGVSCLHYAKENGVGIIAADISKAGRLFNSVPLKAEAFLNSSGCKIELEELCFKWIRSFSEISSIQLSVGAEASSIENIQKYIDWTEKYSEAALSIKEKIVISQIREAYFEKKTTICSSCRCCLPLPCGADVPRMNELLHDADMLSDDSIPRKLFHQEKHHLRVCTDCGLCSKICPKHLPVHLLVKEEYERFSDNRV